MRVGLPNSGNHGRVSHHVDQNYATGNPKQTNQAKHTHLYVLRWIVERRALYNTSSILTVHGGSTHLLTAAWYSLVPVLKSYLPLISGMESILDATVSKKSVFPAGLVCISTALASTAAEISSDACWRRKGARMVRTPCHKNDQTKRITTGIYHKEQR